MGKWRYGVILDAGSSGTRVHIYKWLNSAKARAKADEKELHGLPVLKTDKDWTKKIHPGVSTFGDTPELVGPDHLQPLFEHALDVIPKSQVENTPIFLLATAGMRLLPAPKRKALLEEICAYARENTRFQLPDCDLHIQVIPGETEGLYGWIAANYLLGGFDAPKEHDHGKGHHTYGFLDMGGASAQIAFSPNATEAKKHANDLTLLRMRTIDGKPLEYPVFVTTWLGFGMHEARRRYVEALRNSTSPDTMELPDPCLPRGLNVTTEGKHITKGSDEWKGLQPHLLGTGLFTECLAQTYPLLDKDAPCPDAPCLLHGVHVPAIDFDVNHFVGVSEYWHTTHEIFEEGHKDRAYDFHTYQERVKGFCTQDWSDIEDAIESKKWGKKVNEETAQEVCFKASWLIRMLHDGIGVPRVGIEHLNTDHNGTAELIDNAKEKGYLDPFQAVNEIHDTEVSWTLGKMVLYASSQIPPADKALAVGFGSNGAGIPPDFQYAGGKFDPKIDNLTDAADDDDDDWHDHLFSDSPRRIPGFLMFVVIVAVILFLLCGRERRTTLIAKAKRSLGFNPTGPKRRKVFTGKLFGLSSQPLYERVLEDAEAGEFELADADSENEHSDSSDGTRVGRTSGWATPRLNAAFDRSPGYFDEDALGVGGLVPPSVVGNAMERGGLLARTDSRERLAAPVRSRAGSPTRRSPVLKSVREFSD